MSCYYANDLHKDTTIVNIAHLTKPSRLLIEQDSDPILLNFKRKKLRLPFDEHFFQMMHVTGIILETKNVLSSKMIYFVDNIMTILAKLFTYRSSCLDNYSKRYHNQCTEQPANTQALKK